MMIYLDNAATTFPKPDVVYKKVDELQRYSAFNAGRGSYEEADNASHLIDKCREFLISKSKAEHLIFTPSATHAFNLIINGLEISEGDIIYYSPYDHNAIVRTLYGLQRRKKIVLKSIPLTSNNEIDLNKLNFLLLEDKPKYLFCTHVSNVTGYILPISEMGEICRKNNTDFIVDGAQAFGLINVDLSKNYIKYYVFAGHKTLYGPFGIAGILVNGEIELEVSLFGGTGTDSLNYEMPMNGTLRYEPSSPNIVAIGGLYEAAQWTFTHNIYDHEKELLEYLISKLRLLDDVVIYEAPKENRVGILSFNIKGYKSYEVSLILEKDFNIAVRSDYHCCPDIHKYLDSIKYLGTIRVSVGFSNTYEDIDKILFAINQII